MSSAKILIISQYYKPIKAAAARRVGKIAEYLSQGGYRVTVLTGMPSYPTGILPQKYKGKIWCREREGEINVIRTYEYPVANEAFLKRLINYLSFMFSALIGVLFIPRHDMIIVSSPPLFSAFSGLIGSFVKRSQFVLDVRDLWPDAAVDLGMVKPDSLSVKILSSLERICYRKAKKIITATPALKQHLIEEKWPEEKVGVLINSVNTSLFRPQDVSREKYGFNNDDFILVYLGNHSRVYDLETVLRSAALLEEYPDIKFLLIGEGETKGELQNLCDELRLRNVFFWPEQDPVDVVKIINASDIGLIPIGTVPYFQEALPVKSSEYFACGKPVIAAIGGPMRKWIDEYETGLIVRSGDAESYREAILKLYRDKPGKQKMGTNARKLAMEVFSDEKFYQTLDQTIKGIA
jgi:glycosyltransferase involved in cell wall biosynthesis